MDETTYLLRSPANTKRLLESVAELEAGRGLVKELVEEGTKQEIPSQDNATLTLEPTASSMPNQRRNDGAINGQSMRARQASIA